ncbi:hypothetical protein NQ314_006101 [Rhamnusium bicolor]|uniref:Nucleoside-triphosphatase THEP1 n=1 Tax=Rhamnusium bicolor TaxID=1586634 RepID=A0AAV8Z993_9CUCU|nr:hypothetical protein NQ314_006101 [Rhamnusium bicolor]
MKAILITGPPGQYAVHLADFEKLALPVFEKSKKLLIIDEIGKMEMFSEKFQDSVRKVMMNKDIRFIATIPLKGGPVLVKQLKENRDSMLITVTELNRNHLLDEVVDLITK